MFQDAFEQGIVTGIKLMEQKILKACEEGKPVEIDGRVYFVKSDIQNLREIFAKMEEGDKE
uniref:hypothetical protein n=1 Tax=Waltera acetigignens TaxID=2981769 RepID=UPI003F7F9883